MYLLPIIFILGVLILAILGLIMSRMEFMHRKRFFNKLSLQENISRYGLCRLVGCLILQFNPIFNYIFKPSYYLSRPLRLAFIVNYFLMISSAVLVYFNEQKLVPIKASDIFWFGSILWGLILILRPRI